LLAAAQNTSSRPCTAHSNTPRIGSSDHAIIQVYPLSPSAAAHSCN
jgi:hypothetical protein